MVWLPIVTVLLMALDRTNSAAAYVASVRSRCRGNTFADPRLLPEIMSQQRQIGRGIHVDRALARHRISAQTPTIERALRKKAVGATPIGAAVVNQQLRRPHSGNVGKLRPHQS